jgi:16S rRNA (uracil1498-N3)-methyltransferase
MPLTLDTALDEPAAGLRLMLVEPSASVSVEPMSALRQAPVPADATLYVGPEGGWAADECSAAVAKGVCLISLGPRTLRADAVAVAAISVLNFLWEDG